MTGGRYGPLNLALTDEDILRLWERFRPMAHELFARRAVDVALRDRAVIVLPRWWKVFWYLERLSPGLSLRLSEQLHRRALAELADADALPYRPKSTRS